MHCSAALALSVPHNVPTPMLCPNVSKSAKPQKSCNEMISVADMGGGRTVGLFSEGGGGGGGG
jgi:hypothetical protein